MEYTTEVLNQLRDTEQEILDIIVCFCEAHGLKYSLGYGTLIGAIRHKGFIPWDDDIDILMPRSDYLFLKENWDNKEYYLQDYYNDPDFTNNFIKIRKNHTTFFTDAPGENKELSGIFVDIFPADRVPESKIGQKIQYVASAVNLLFSRGYPSGSGGVKGKIEKMLLKLPRKTQIRIRNRAEGMKRLWNRWNKGQYVNGSTINESLIYYPSDLFDSFIDVTFNGKKYKSIKKYHEFLTIMYSDYMQLPPEKERVWGHKPKLLSFEKNYNELMEE